MKKHLLFLSFMMLATLFCQTWAQTPTSCNPTLPYLYDFNNSTHNDCWTIVDNNNDESTFTFSTGGKYAQYHYNNTNSADDWLISPVLQLTGTEYLLFDYKCNSASYHERFQVFAISGTDTIPLSSVIETQGNDYQTLPLDLSTLNGQYQIGFHCVSIPDQYFLYITNIRIISPPYVSFNKTDVEFGLLEIGNSSPAQQVVMTSFGCNSPITLTAPAGFEVSLDTVNYASSLAFPATTMEMRKDTFYVRFAPTTGGPFNKKLTVSSGTYEDHIMLHGLVHACNATMTLPFSENFENSFVYCWTILDQDGDGNTWAQYSSSSYAHSGSKAIHAASVYDSYNEQHIMQDNWLISQPVYISDTAYLSYYVDAISWSLFTYSVLVSTTGNNPSDFSLLFADSSSSDNFHHRKISLADYVGQTIYLAFRNNSIHDCVIDDITIATLEDHPIVITTPNYIDYKTLSIGFGEVRSFQVETSGPVGNLSVSGTSLCDFSLDGINFSNTVSLPSTGGTVYVRLTLTTTGYSNQVVTVAAENAENQIVKLRGRGLQCFNTIPYTHNFNNSRNDCWSSINANQDYHIFYISGGTADININSGTDMDDWLISPMFELNGNQFGFFEYWKPRHKQKTTFQVYAITALDTVPISQVVTVDDKEHHLFYFDLASLQGFYHLGIRVMSDTSDNQEFFSITNFNIQNVTPLLIVNPDTLDFGLAFLEDNHQRPVELLKVGISTPVSISVQAPFEVSLDGVNYNTTLSIPASTGNVKYDTVLVRMMPSTTGNFTGWMTSSVAGLTDSVYLTGNVPNCHNTIPYTYSFTNSDWNECWTIVNANGDGSTFSLDTINKRARYIYSYSNPADDWLISPYFHFNGNQYGSIEYRASNSYLTERFEVYALGADTILITSVIEVNNTSYQKLIWDNLSVLNGNYRIGIHCVSPNNSGYLYFCNFNVFNLPNLLLSNDSINFPITNLGSSSAAQQVVLQQAGVTAPITVTVPTHFEVSADGVNFGTQCTIPADTAFIATDTFYVRFSPLQKDAITGQLIVSVANVADTMQLMGFGRDCNDTIQLPFREGFEGPFSYCWTILDQDGDGKTWVQRNGSYYAHTGGYSVYSASHYDSELGEHIPQDNWLISQPVYISDTAYLSYYAKSSSWSTLIHSVYVSTTGNSPSDFTEFFTDTTNNGYYSRIRVLSLADYVGQTIYIAFRILAESDCYLDDVTIATKEDQPLLIATPRYIDYDYISVGYGEVRSFQVETIGNVGNIVISGNSICDFSTDGITFSNPLTLSSNGGTVYARLTSTSTGNKSETVNISSEYADLQNVELNAYALECYNTIPYAYSFNISNRNNCWNVVNDNLDDCRFQVYASNAYAYLRVYSNRTIDDWLISPIFEFTGNQYGFFDYWGVNGNRNFGDIQVFALGALDTIPISPVVKVPDAGHKQLYYDLSSLQGPYHIGIHVTADTISYIEYLYITNFNIQNMAPALSVNPDTLDFGSEIVEDTHLSYPVDVTTVEIANPITITVPAPFEVSVDGGVTYGTSMTIPGNSATLVYDTVLVRMSPTASGNYTGWLVVSTTGLTDSVYLMGSAPDCHNTIPYSYSFTNSQWNECWTIVNANDDVRKFTLSTSSGYAYYLYNSSIPADDWLISPYFLFDGMQYGSIDCRKTSSGYSERFEVYALGADTILIMPVMEVNSSSYEIVMLDFTQLNGTYRIGFHCVSPANQYYLYLKNFNVLPLVSDLTLNHDTIDFGKQSVNTPTVAQEVLVNLEGIFTSIPITVPAPFEVSLDGNTFSGSVTLPAKSTAFAVDTFYVRFNPNAVGVFNTMLVVSAGTVADTVLLYGEAFNCAVAQPLPIVEGFETTLSPCWTILDADGDGENWMSTASFTSSSYAGHESSLAYVSRSWNSTALDPDNWLVSPLIAPTVNTVLTFFVKGSYSTEHFAVYVSTDNTVSSFMATTPIIVGTSTNEWKQYVTRLSDYVGDSVYVAFRHYNSYDLYHLLLDDVVITDSLEHPFLTVNPEELTFGMVGTGEVATDSVVVDGYGFTSTMIATVANPFTISMDGVNFTNILAIPPVGGTLYVRYAPTSEGTHNGTITLMPPGIDNVTIALHGTGMDCQNTVPYSYQFNDNRILCWTVENANQDNNTFLFSTADSCAYYYYHSQNAADDWLISPQFTFNGNMYGYFDYRTASSSYPERYEVFALGADTIRLTQPMQVTNTSIERQLLDFTSLIGPYRIGIHCISDADRYIFYIQNFNILNVTPTFMTNVDSLDFGMQLLNTLSTPQQVILTSIGVYTPITVTAPAHFEVSLDNMNYSSSLTLPFHITSLVNDTIFVRFAPTAAGYFNNQLIISSNNLQKSIVLKGASRDCDAVATVPFMEDFEGYNTYCWTIEDGDNDGYNWWKDDYASQAHSGTGYMLSESYANAPLCPDNWLISQPIQLPEIPARLSFWVSSYASYYADEHYSVYVSTTGNTIQDFTNTVFTSVSTYGYQQQSISLRDYAGQTIYIAFRHHNTCDQFKLLLDDISIQQDTVPQLPLVATDSVMATTQLSAAGVGHIVFDGNTAITDRGFCWSTSPNPTLSDSHVSSPTPSASFMGMLTGLSEHTTYHLRAYATNSFGTVYGEDVVFTTLCGPATYTSFNQTACESYTWNGTTYETSGDYVQTLENVIGCDSIVTMHLTIYHGDTTEFVQTACETFTWANTNYTTSGDYTKTFANVHGCDSVVTMHLTIYHGNTTAFSDTACESYTWDNTVYTVSGDYTKTFANVHGCDSVVTLHLTVYYGDSTEFEQTVCEFYTWDNTTYTVSGDFTHTYANQNGCDSVVTLHLTVHYGDSTEFEQTTCDSYVWNDSTYTVSGDYTRLFENENGCDSVVTMHLTVYPSVTNEIVISCPDSCYEWNGQSYCASGDYTQVLQTVHGCDSTVLMHLTITVGVENPVIDQNLQVYPNPTNGLLSIRGTAFTQVLLFDAYGKRIGVWNVEGDVTQIDLSPYAPGVYFVKVMDKQQIVGVKKVIKQ